MQRKLVTAAFYFFHTDFNVWKINFNFPLS